METQSTGNHDLCSSFMEHHLDRRELSELFIRSNINVVQPSASTGLSSEEAKRCLERDGRNALTPPKKMSDWMLLLRQLLNMFWLFLTAAGVLNLCTYLLDPTSPSKNLYIACVLFGIVVFMCLVSFYIEKKAREVLRGFQALLPRSCWVIRDGHKSTICAEELVVGDLVLLRSGVRVPADVRMLSCNGLKLETSSLTGEAEPIELTCESAAKSTTIFESYNVAFNGSFCVDGEGLGVVIRVADKTVIGQIASLTTNHEGEKSSLEKQVIKFVRFITILAVSMATVVFVIGAAMNNFCNMMSIFINGFLVVIVANVPQGLPTTLISQLTIIARRMAKKNNVYMKKLDVIETFGAVTVIASDKAGILTKNAMSVTDLWYNMHYISVRPDAKLRTVYAKQNATHTLDLSESPLPEMLAVMTLCNKAHIDMSVTNVPRRQSLIRNSTHILWVPVPERSAEIGDPQNSRTASGRHLQAQMTLETSNRKNISGNPSEVALLRFASQMVDVQDMHNRFEIVFEIPFNSVRKWHLIIAKRTDGVAEDGTATFTLMMKGAPELLIELCSTLANATGEQDLDANEKLDLQNAYLHFGNEGRRVIGFASKTFVAAEDIEFSQDARNYPQGKYCFLGMAAIWDPPRDDTAQAIQECKDAGIKVFIITGDHPTTAAAIARQIGLFKHSGTQLRHEQVPMIEEKEVDCTIVHGQSLQTLTVQQWDDLLLKKNIVFARTTPEHKLMIIEQCQKRGEVVAATGDGIQDVSALKRADIGIAVDIVGSDLAKQATDIILMDGNFSSIVKGIEEGRLLYDNLKKTIAYTLTHVIPEIIPIILNVTLGFPVGLTSLQILSIDLGSELAPAISLAYEPSEQDIMKRPPRKRNAQLVSWALLAYSYLFAGCIVTIGCFAAYLSVFRYHGISIGDIAFSSADHWTVGAKNLTSNGLMFSDSVQLQIMGEAAAAWHITIVMSQVFHLWMCATRRISIFRHGITNMVAVVACIIATLLINLFVYMPGVQYVMGTSPPPTHVWGFCAIVGVVLCVFNEWRKFLIRRCPHNAFVKIFKW